MTAVATLFGTFAVLLIAAFGYVGWRDRRRLSSPEDSAAARAARSAQHGYTAEGHGVHSEQRVDEPGF